MKQFNRFIDPKKDLGSFSGMVCLYLLVMVFVSIISTFTITLFMFGRYGLEMAEKQEYVEKLINGNGISYLISVSIGVLLFALYRQGSLFKGDVRQKGRKMTWQTFLVFIAFLGFSQLASSALSQLLDHMMETLGFFKPQEDMSEQLIKIGMEHSKSQRCHDNRKHFSVLF